MHDTFDTLVGITIAEHDAERGYAEQLVCSDVDTETLHALATAGGLSRLVGKLDDLASLAAGLVRAGHESSTVAMVRNITTMTDSEE